MNRSMADEGDLPYKTEYAKSNRASCKACKGIISKETLRMARMVQSPHFDGKVHHSVMLLPLLECAQVLGNGSDFHSRLVMSSAQIPHWYHFNCFFKKFRPPSTGDVGGFHSLRWDDQKRIESVLAGEGGGTSGGAMASGGGGTKKKVKGKSESTVALAPPTLETRDDLKVEYARSGRSKCRKCFDLIEQVS